MFDKQPILTDDAKIAIIKNAIASQAGWKSLAQSIKSAPNPGEAFDKCIDLMSKMAGEKDIVLPTMDKKGNISTDTISVKYIDILTSELLKYMKE